MAKALRNARYPLIIILVLACVTLFIWSSSTQKNQARAVLPLVTPTTLDLEVALLRSGLGPEALTATGLSSANAVTVVGDLITYMTTNPGVLDSADASYSSAKSTTDQLKRTIQSGLATTQDLTAFASAKANLASCTIACDGVIDDFFTAATADLSQAQKTALSTIRGNAYWDRPTEFLTVAHTEEQWVELRNALAHERIATANGEAVDAGVQTILNGYRGNGTVAAAKANLDSNLAVVTFAWEQAIEQ
ncbi:MAG: hypothetical protein IH984_06110 [Planctomycetes bacterium]|nr:hypothetical protein [Planctomycetota bacterium]